MNWKFRMNIKPAVAQVCTALCCLTAAALPGAAMAQAYPTKTVKFIVPFPPGGAIDTLARLVGQQLSATWGQPVVIENRPGAGGTIGTDQVAKSSADGYTLGWGAVSTHGMNAALYKKLPYDTLKAFTPVARVAVVPNVLVIHPALPPQNVNDFIRMARSQTHRLSYASAGSGSTLHVSCELFSRLAKVEMLHVPYKGSGPALADVIGGQVPVMCDSLTSALPHIRAGKLKALGVTSVTRSPLLPSIPTLAEAGVKNYEMTPWYGVFAPAGTPPSIVSQVNADINKILEQPDVKARFALIGAEPVPATPEQFAAQVRTDMARWGKLIKELAITID
jgi:tripartite-type tricarboxylate transporter receptor subunit TctC